MENLHFCVKKLCFLNKIKFMAKIALFHVVVHSLMSGLMDESRLLISASVFDVLRSVVLVLRYKETLLSYRPVVGK